MGVDIVIDATHGPVVLEVNARPGLAIQHANAASLRTRLERVGGIDRPSPERALSIARSLFAEPVADKIATRGPDVEILGVIEPVVIHHNDREHEVEAKIDTGAYRTSIDVNVARELRLEPTERAVAVRSASGGERRPTVQLTIRLGGREIETIASLAEREHMNYPMIIGRRDLAGFLVDPTLHLFAHSDKRGDRRGGDIKRW